MRPGKKSVGQTVAETVESIPGGNEEARGVRLGHAGRSEGGATLRLCRQKNFFFHLTVVSRLTGRHPALPAAHYPGPIIRRTLLT